MNRRKLMCIDENETKMREREKRRHILSHNVRIQCTREFEFQTNGKKTKKKNNQSTVVMMGRKLSSSSSSFYSIIKTRNGRTN